MRKIKVGIIGCGHWGPNFIRNFTQLPDVEVRAVCDKKQDKLGHIGGLYPGLPLYHDYREAFKTVDLDAVVISTPASTHYTIAKDALMRGLHVLVEKPISVSVNDAEKLIRLSEKAKKILMVGHTFLFNPAVNKIKEILDKKELGDIYYIHSRRTNLGPLRQDVNAIWDLSPHDISIINYLLGAQPLEVCAHAQKFLSHKFEDVGFVILKYPKNVLAHIHASWLDPKKIRELTIIGSRKMLVYDDINPSQPIKVYDKSVMEKSYDKDYNTFREFQLIIRDGKESSPEVVKEEPLKAECSHFIDCLRNGLRPKTDGKNGLDILKALCAVDRSLKSKGRTVKLK